MRLKNYYLFLVSHSFLIKWYKLLKYRSQHECKANMKETRRTKHKNDEEARQTQNIFKISLKDWKKNCEKHSQ